MAEVRVENLTKRFDNVVAVRNLSLTVNDGEFVVFLGPSGCGKTTTLRCIAGLEIPDGGEIRIGDDVVTNLPPAMRDIAFVFQQYALYPHLTVFDNLAFPLRATRTPKDVIARRVQEVAKILRIERVLERRPSKISGGEMQRVAIGRAMVRRPKVFLMDEPLTNLDAKLRMEMRTELKRLQADQQATTVYVTHDQVEAMSMGDRVAVINEGRLLQFGTPGEVYDHPRDMFVAGFIGSPAMNMIPCSVEDGHIALSGGEAMSLSSAPSRFRDLPREANLVLGARPEDVALSTEPAKEFLQGEVYVVEPLGSENIIDVRLAGHLLKARTPPTFLVKTGQPIYVRVDLERAHIFDPTTQEALF
ncbi:MAG: ABC transporter ATP-binding protein [Fimbriimonadia bacterium]|jgi:multiple sugar transport system ATP-binding protein